MRILALGKREVLGARKVVKIKLIIAGTRTITDYSILVKALESSGFSGEVTEVVSGGAAGPDTLGERWAKEKGIKVKRFPADWDKYGKSAGPRRNKQMAEYVGKDGALLALWDGTSAGTKHMIFVARGMGMKGKIYKPINKGK